MSQTWYVHPIRVRYQETDQMGVVFHGNYVTWFEIGRTEWVRAVGVPYTEFEKNGVMLPVIDLQVSYMLPAKYDDMVVICTKAVNMSPLRITFHSQVRRVYEQDFKSGYFAEDALPGELLATGATKHVWVNQQFQPTRLNKIMPDIYNKLMQC